MESTLYTINQKRLLQTLAVSSSIGPSKNGGLHRLALTEQDREMRDQLKKWFVEAGLSVRVDDFGNMYGRRTGKQEEGPVLAMGSHMDSQPSGGKFDGVLGVLTALEVIRTLNELGLETEYPIEIVNFTNEEGARFGPPMLGSGGIAEAFSKEYIYNIKDKEGTSFAEALRQIEYKGEEQNRLTNLLGFIELHIEQGPILAKENVDIGIVEGVQGMSWLNVEVKGESNHAGPTPMEDRKDALLSASKMISKINELHKEIKGLKTTVGQLDVYPNVPNVIPGSVSFSVDIRHEKDEVRKHAVERMKEQLSTMAFTNNADVVIQTTWNSDAVTFSNHMKEYMEQSAAARGYSSKRLFSGPGHDAKYIRHMAPAGMIFLPSQHGQSHNEKELTLEEDIEKGANVLLDVILKCTKQKIENIEVRNID
ncbi:M20 family metallo-hydrolase [Alteribacillus bidgolensis]|uniref:N-carbamoyl-L-amino-acid hydrolase n=1 Tax=Alteribacillus bidgolensis TaxID=930129 RepID=A0A1G8NMJ5_9BACI|nr:M20 family metallo-hydrolase [Alteribacillus bidgolensis]SDI81521.1 N-carbamoyl-L-amino-acid hydrolase [Alteribacillus bidgolensis]